MSQTVALALITAGAGLLGALLGAVAAVLGPWWLRRSDRIALAEVERIESQRRAILGWTDAQVALVNVIHLAPSPTVSTAAGRANAALTELLSRLERTDVTARAFLRGAASAIPLYDDVDRQRAAAGRAGEALLAWHKGVTEEMPMVPYLVAGREPNDVAKAALFELATWEEVRGALHREATMRASKSGNDSASRGG